MKNQAMKGAKPSHRRAKASPPPPKNPGYISFNKQEEKKRLLMLGFRERWAYLELKGLSNFKTGVCGEYKDQRLSYAQIAALVTAPGTQGRGQGGIDDTQAADFLQRMVAVGLVANIGRRSNGGLRFDLPLSPIKDAEAAQSGEVCAKPSGEMVDIFPAEVAPQMPESPAPATVFDVSDHSLSVMINKERNISNDEAGSASAEPASGRTTGAAPAREYPATQPTPEASLTAREIHEAIYGNWTFRETDTPEALALYDTWAVAGITIGDLHAAMTSLELDASCPDLTPANLTSALWPKVVDGWVDQLAA